jgi:hypothetical protein
VNRGRSLALLAAVSGVITVYIGTSSREPSSPPAPFMSDHAKGPGVVGAHVAPRTEKKRRPLDPEGPVPESTTVIVLPRTTQPINLPPPRSFAGDPVGLVREVQRELKRVGCYFQEINGEWSPATRRATKDFMDRVNTVLPLDAPDPVFLALLQSERTVVCGNTCPAGQDLTRDNRCLPSALLALSPPQIAALLERPDTKKLVGDTSAPQPANPTAASVPSAYRARRRPNNFGSWVFGVFGW